jgi:hypothetical protein
MKRQIIGLLIFAMVTVVTSCKKDDNSPNNNSNSSTSSIITTGSWRVSYYHESGDDNTSNFNGYTFNFNSNGTMTATHSSGTTNGTWSSDDSKNEFHMSMGNNSPCSDLNNGWLIISKTSSEIDMKDDNSAHNEELHFTKI